MFRRQEGVGAGFGPDAGRNPGLAGRQQGKLHGFRIRRPVEVGDQPAVAILAGSREPQRLVLDEGPQRGAIGRRRRTGAAQHGTDAGEQFARIARLGEIIGRAHFQADNPVHIAAHGAEHDHRRSIGAQLAQRGKPVFARHHHVKDDEIERFARHLFAHVGRVGRRGDGKAVPFQKLADQGADAFVIIDDQDARRKVHGFEV